MTTSPLPAQARIIDIHAADVQSNQPRKDARVSRSPWRVEEWDEGLIDFNACIPLTRACSATSPSPGRGERQRPGNR
ncbi:hypothetical protein CHELA20_53111 [Hyphomicrobiales bacterium]|nr:hypothetical protein CHELA41_21813 [Hyphomicrobiales bacterium]CAH1683596.1 hypothetical protein CHELA20_53111 [Hyphomicrobiales bacterium]